MLVSFKIKNVLSFKNEQLISFVSGLTQNKSDRLFNLGNGYSCLKFSAIYGANASGKSNIIKAMSIMRKLVLLSTCPFENHFYFAFSEEKLPSSFEIVLCYNKKMYRYGIEADFHTNKLCYEWLDSINGTKIESIFFRDVANKTIKFSKMKSFPKELQTRIKVYIDDLIGKECISLIKDFSEKRDLFKTPEMEGLFYVDRFFHNDLRIVKPDSDSESTFRIDEENINKISSFLKSFDTDVEKIDCVKISENQLEDYIGKDTLENIKQDIADFKEKKSKHNYAIVLRMKSGIFMAKLKDDEITYFKYVFRHSTNTKVEFDFADESDGTLRLFELASIILGEAKNRVYLVDEIDRRFHPQLTYNFISRFLKKCEKPEFENQLIVTTHESHLLDFSLLRRDEIWFVNKEHGESTIYSLDEFNVRFDKRIEKAYLNGRYGGIPLFDSIYPLEKE